MPCTLNSRPLYSARTVDAGAVNRHRRRLGIETNPVASRSETHAVSQTSGEVMAKWYFKTAALNARNSSRHLWYWQIDSDATVIFTGIRLFATLSECVADA